MVDETQAKGRIFTAEERLAGQASQAKLRRSPITNIVAMQEVLMRRVINADPDARDVATCACAWDKLEERRREAQGKARLAPVKSEPKRAGRTAVSVSRVRPDVLQVAQGAESPAQVAEPPTSADPAS